MANEIPKTVYKVFACPKCGRYSYAKVGQKGRKCGYCQHQINLTGINGEQVAGMKLAHDRAVQLDREQFAHQGITLPASKDTVQKQKPIPSPVFKKENSREEQMAVIRQKILEDVDHKKTTFSPQTPAEILHIYFEHFGKNSGISFVDFQIYFYQQLGSPIP